MRFILVTKEKALTEAAAEGFVSPDTFESYTDWVEALERSEGADLIFVDLLATLEEENKISGYEKFAAAKMSHAAAKGIPLVLISPPEDYELDFMSGWPGFVFANIRRPVTAKIFRRASTWV